MPFEKIRIFAEEFFPKSWFEYTAEMELDTKFGKLTFMYPVGLNYDSKVRILDSDKKYFDYLELESFTVPAEEKHTSVYAEILSQKYEAENISDIRSLLNFLAIDYVSYEEKNETKTASYPDFLNRIGNYEVYMSE